METDIDYKIAAKTLANRFKYVLHSIISPEQTGFLKGRYIGENVHIVLDTISYCNTHSIQGSLVSLDFEKAFDSLDHSFIDYVFAYFNIDHTFRKWIRTLYYNAEACVSSNGYCSNYFSVLRGVRQGCPLSPYIYILCSEILCMRIKQNNHIKGIYIMDNVEINITQYADRTTQYSLLMALSVLSIQ